VNESSHGGDLLVGDIEFGGTVLGVLLSDSVDLLGDLSSVVESILSSSRNSVGNSGRMPGSNTGNLSETLVCLSGQFLGSPSGCDSSESLSLGYSKSINHLILVEDGIDRDWLLKKSLSEGDLVFHGSSVDLDLDELSSSGSSDDLGGLGVSQNSERSAILLHLSEGSLGDLGVLSVLLGVLGEGLLLGRIPGLVVSSSNIIGKMVGPDSGELSSSSRSRDVSNSSNNDHGRSLEDGNSFDDFLLVDLGTRLVDLSDDVCASSLESNKSGQMGLLAGIILREGSDSSSEGLCPLSWEKS